MCDALGYDPHLYIRALEQSIEAREAELAPPTQSCATHKHFGDCMHNFADMMICIVDALPKELRSKPAILPALRKRLDPSLRCVPQQA